MESRAEQGYAESVKTGWTVAAAVVAAALAAWAIYVLVPVMAKGPRRDLTSEEERVVRIALEALEGRDVPDPWDVEVELDEAGEYWVTWPVRPTDPPSPGPSFYYRLRVDPVRGAVTRRQVGN